jgi:hypothetical protein
MRLVFNVMLAVSVAVALTGITLGAQARFAGERPREPEQESGTQHTAALRRAPRERVAFEQTIAPPVPVSPRFATAVWGPPALAWRLEEGTDGARVELCPSSDFDDAKTVRLDVSGDHVQLPAPWPSGVWYWRLRGRTRAYVGQRTTPTWMLYVGAPQGLANASETDFGEPMAPTARPPAVTDTDWYEKVSALIDEVRAPGSGSYTKGTGMPTTTQ